MTKARASEKKTEKAARREVIATALAMSESGLSPGRSGNVSCRWTDGMLITPTGKAYSELEASDIVYMTAKGNVPGKQLKPSSEWHFHLAAYWARPDMSALVHTHSPNATALACAQKPIPAFHYMVAVAGGIDIPLVPYATFGTEELAGNVARGLADRNAILMANHGAIALGATLGAALELAREVEVLAEQYIKVLTLGPVHVLDDAEMARVIVKFKTYGQRGQG